MTISDLLIRAASLQDSAELLAWRNDATTRAMSFDSKIVTEREHQKWLSDTLANSKKQILIGEYAGEKVGMCRFDISPDLLSAEISINVNPALRGRGFAAPLLQNSLTHFMTTHSIRILARTKVNNLASRKIFEKAGFIKQKTAGDIIHWLFFV